VGDFSWRYSHNVKCEGRSEGAASLYSKLEAGPDTIRWRNHAFLYSTSGVADGAPYCVDINIAYIWT